MKQPKVLLATMLVALLCLADSDAKVVYVNAVAPAGGSGTSWPTACRYLQDALDLTVAGDEVWVAAGTYYPDQGAAVTTGDRVASFTLKQNVKIFGGFVGGETTLGQRNPVTNPTILSGEIWTEKLYWSLHVVTLAGNATLDGVTVTKGNANGDAAPFNQGGGVFVSGRFSLSVNQCIFTTNTATSGGAIYSSSSITATNCTFSGNTASNSGGAIDSSSVTATNCTFSGNTAYSSGAIDSSSVTATNCTFSGNTASYSGGAIDSSSVTATNCTFSGNSAPFGGAIGCSSVTATNCTFSSNTASSMGGAIYSWGESWAGSSVTATNCTFSNNSVTTSSISSSGTGGAIYSRGASVTATNCTFSSNTASSYGGAISSPNSSSSSVIATNCTLVNNLARGTGKKGGAIYATGLVKIFNNILWHTLTEAQDNLIYITSTGSLRNADVDFPSPLNQAKNLIKGGFAAITAEAGAVISLGTTSVTIPSADPLFLNAGNPVGADGIWKTADDGLRLQASSPAVDLGLSMYLPVDTYDLDKDNNKTEQLPVDLAGFARIQRAALDLGAYEQSASLLQIWRQTHFGSYDDSGDGADLNDFDHDGIPNLLEFAFGLDPKQNSAGQIPQLQRSGDNFVITFTQPASAGGIIYGAEWSTTLLPGSWTSISNSSLLPQHTFSVPMGSKTSLYMRLKVSAP